MNYGYTFTSLIDSGTDCCVVVFGRQIHADDEHFKTHRLRCHPLCVTAVRLLPVRRVHLLRPERHGMTGSAISLSSIIVLLSDHDLFSSDVQTNCTFMSSFVFPFLWSACGRSRMCRTIRSFSRGCTPVHNYHHNYQSKLSVM